MKYKVGDRVMTNENSVYFERMFNKTATIIYIDPDTVPDRYLLEFDEDVDGHNGLGEFEGKDKHCWYVWENDFELIESTHLEFKKDEPTTYQLYKPNGIGNVTIDTLSDYMNCIAQVVLDKPIEETKTFNIKGENEMNRIVELYEERNRGKIYTEYNKKCAKIKLADENYKVYKECLDKLIPIYEKTKQCFHNITEPYLSEETAKKLNELELKKEAELTKLENELAEIKAQISMCETYEQKQSVLKLYKVIDENGKLNA